MRTGTKNANTPQSPASGSPGGLSDDHPHPTTHSYSHSHTSGVPIPLAHVDGATVLEPWFVELARVFLVEIEVDIEVALRGEQPTISFPGRRGSCTVSALTALFLAM